MKKRFVIGIFIIVFLCGITSIYIYLNEFEEKEISVIQKEKIILSFLTSKRETRHIYKKIIDDFNALQDEIYVEQLVVPDPEEELKIRAIQGEFPDIVELSGVDCNVNNEYIKGGYLYPITDFSCADKVDSQFLEKLEVSGEYYIIPLSASYRGLFINRDLMEENGYQIPETYEELMNILEQIKAAGEAALVFPDKDSWTIHQGWDAIDTVSRGSQETLFQNAAEGIETMDQDGQAVVTTKKMLKLRAYGQKNMLNMSYDEAIKAFADEEAYMFLQGNWAYSLIKKTNPDIDIAFVPFPVEEGTEPKIVVRIDSAVGISASCQNLNAAESFLNYLLSDEVIDYYSDEAGAYSCIQSSARIGSYDEIFVKRLQEGSFEIETIAFSNEIDAARNNLFRSLVSQPGKYTVENFLKEYSELLLFNQQRIY